MKDPYASLAQYYDYLHPDGEEALRITGDWLHGILKPLEARSILDCTCGTGLQAIALAGRGYGVTGSDISKPMLRKAREKGRAAGVEIRWVHADMTRLEASLKRQFDAVITCGNSLLHLTCLDDLYLAARSMFGVTRHGGNLLVSMADSEESLFDPHPFMSGRVALPDGRALSLYTTRERHGDITTLNVFTAVDAPEGPQVTHTSMRLRIHGREELTDTLTQAGFSGIADISRKGSITLLVRKP